MPKEKSVALQLLRNQNADTVGQVILSSATLLLVGSAVGALNTHTYETISVDCHQNPGDGAIIDVNELPFPARLDFELKSGSSKLSVTVKNAGQLAVNGREIHSTDAGSVVLTLNDGTELIAGAPTPVTLDGYTAATEALTLACDKATPESVALAKDN